MNLKVLMVCSQYPPVYGGAGQQAALLAEHLHRKGWRVTVVTLDQLSKGSSTDGGFKVKRVSCLSGRAGRLARGVSTIGLGLAAAWTVLRDRPDVVHIHGSYWWAIPPAVLGRMLRKRVVVKVTRDGEDDPRTVHAKRVGRLPVGMLYALAFRSANKIVFLNDSGFRDALGYGYAGKATRMFNGVDSKKLTRTIQRRTSARSIFGVHQESIIVLFVGYLAPHKGVLDLLDAWPAVEDKFPNAELWLVGPGSGFYRELSESVDNEMEVLRNVGYSVKAFGHVPAQQMPQYYWAADIFTLPSYREGMPNSLAEAMVAGCTPVATKIPGIVDICPQDYRLLVPPGDSRLLAAALQDAIKNREPISGEHLQKLDIFTVTDDYLELYNG
ncbi:glycosyltransferase family 4 protein [Rhodococcus fascians]|nr:glycosyltransferase family 4 protein [Rhodococcus fascians]MBY4060981.1 glycosyltransferase family 4 protein [Rhodococcus fascians]MBY4071157.1 glycosyltransferase family 4 protein [Rhodococcus fascians]